jgi:hypothetical protein
MQDLRKIIEKRTTFALSVSEGEDTKYTFALGVSEGEGIRVRESFCVSPKMFVAAI